MAYYKVRAFPNQVDRYHDFMTMRRIGIDWEEIGDITNLSDDDIKKTSSIFMATKNSLPA